MRKLLLLNSLIIATGLNAQPVVSYNSSHSIGTQATLYSVGGTPTTLLQNGANVTWNLTASPLTQAGTVAFVDPATTPNGASYPAANIAFAQTLTGLGTFYSYLQDTPSELNSIADNVGSPNPTVYTDYDKVLQYPFNFGNSFTDTRQEMAGSVETFTRTYDGYGTLIANGNTYTNIVRVHEDANSFVFFITDPVVFPIVIVGGSGVLFLEPGVTSVNELVNQNPLNIYPNPAKQEINIDLGIQIISNIKIVNAIGEVVETISDEIQQRISVEHLSPGLYWILVTNSKGLELREKFVKQ